LTKKLPCTKRQKVRYEETGNHYLSWLHKACDTLSAARVLRQVLPDEGNVLPSAFLLYALCLENLFKSLWIKQGNEFVSQLKIVTNQDIKTHDLIDLAKKTGFALSQSETDTLRSISDKSTSTSRYPIAINFEKHKVKKTNSGIGFRDVSVYIETDLDTAEVIISRLLKSFGL
jgi:hypothetical protein